MINEIMDKVLPNPFLRCKGDMTLAQRIKNEYAAVILPEIKIKCREVQFYHNKLHAVGLALRFNCLKIAYAFILGHIFYDNFIT